MALSVLFLVAVTCGKKAGRHLTPWINHNALELALVTDPSQGPDERAVLPYPLARRKVRALFLNSLNLSSTAAMTITLSTVLAFALMLFLFRNSLPAASRTLLPTSHLWLEGSVSTVIVSSEARCCQPSGISARDCRIATCSVSLKLDVLLDYRGRIRGDKKNGGNGGIGASSSAGTKSSGCSGSGMYTGTWSSGKVFDNLWKVTLLMLFAAKSDFSSVPAIFSIAVPLQLKAVVIEFAALVGKIGEFVAMVHLFCYFIIDVLDTLYNSRCSSHTGIDNEAASSMTPVAEEDETQRYINDAESAKSMLYPSSTLPNTRRDVVSYTFATIECSSPQKWPRVQKHAHSNSNIIHNRVQEGAGSSRPVSSNDLGQSAPTGEDGSSHWKSSSKGAHSKHKLKKRHGKTKLKDMTGDKNERVVYKEITTQTYQCPVLNNTNYTLWALRMKKILMANGVWDLIEGTSTSKETDIKRDSSASAYLFQGLPEDLLMVIKKIMKIDAAEPFNVPVNLLLLEYL
ncbi:hypothetical protein Tco_0592821 [Tanacetum coccineum]